MNGPDLRDRLFAAYHDGDQRSFVELCQRHAEEIMLLFDGWRIAPVENRDDRQAVETYIQALVAIARVLRVLGHPEPLEMIMPDGPANPIERWKYMYLRAQQLNEAGEFAASSAELHILLADMGGTIGTGVDDIRAKVFGLLGTNALRLSVIPEALRYFEDALRLCVASGDREGMWIYAESLEIVRVAKEVKAGAIAGRQLIHTRERIAFAQDLSDARRYPASNDVLHDLLDEVTNNATPGVRYLGKLYGLLGLNYFRLGDLSAARRFTEQALAESQQRQDIAGDRIYSANLKVISETKDRTIPDRMTPRRIPSPGSLMTGDSSN